MFLLFVSVCMKLAVGTADGGKTDILHHQLSIPSTYFDSSFVTIATSLSAPNSISSADIDGDGDVDIVASYWTDDSIVSSETLIHLYLQTFHFFILEFFIILPRHGTIQTEMFLLPLRRGSLLLEIRMALMKYVL